MTKLLPPERGFFRLLDFILQGYTEIIDEQNYKFIKLVFIFFTHAANDMLNANLLHNWRQHIICSF